MFVPETVYQNTIPTEVISDGRVNKANLNDLNLTMDWLRQQLKQASVTSISDIFYTEVGKDGSLYIDDQQDFVH
ncbi:YetF domain-containing protein [Halobacillus locisalis]|uniref:YetF domain-containing protein n=1 Tax=Halobacillus locisalis TaxID=220753 RepID=UPI001FE5ACD7|nr:YetF domain-containing protein [Halobacillus locisalis]